MAKLVATIVVIILAVAAVPSGAQQPARPKILTSHLPKPPEGRFPNGVYYRLFDEYGHTRVVLENKSDKSVEEFSIWVAMFGPTRSLLQVFSFTTPVLEAGEAAVVAPEGSDSWPSVTVTSFRVAQWESIVQESPNREVLGELTVPVRGGLTHSTQAFTITFSLDPEEIGFALVNKSARPIRILWDESTFIDSSGRTHRIMHVGVRYNERDQPMPPTVVPPGSRVEDIILPTSYVEWTGRRWERKPIYGLDGTPAPFGVFLSLRVGEQPVEVTYRFGFRVAWPSYVTALFGR